MANEARVSIIWREREREKRVGGGLNLKSLPRVTVFQKAKKKLQTRKKKTTRNGKVKIRMTLWL